MRGWRRWAAMGLVGGLVACGGEGEGEQTGPAVGSPMPGGQLGDAVVPVRYDLDLTILPDLPGFSGHVTIDVTVNRPSRTIWLHGMDIEVSRAWVESGDRSLEASWEQADPTGIARLTLDDLPAAGPARLHFLYDAPYNGALEGLYKVTDGGEDYAFTQFEATSARLAFPSFDEPVFKTPFDIRVTAREDHAVITSTPEIAAEPAGEGLVKRTYATTPPLPTYLIAFAVGPLDVVEGAPLPPTAVRDRPLPLRGVATRGKGAQLAYAIENTRPIVEALESYFGIAFPYPKLDIIAVPDFAAGAMENVGAITYREQLLLLNERASAGQKRAYVSVHAHELAHQWFGNLVTPKWWDDIWLNESFATWMGNKAAHAAFPEAGLANSTFNGALGVMNADALATARQIRQPIESNHDIATAFDGITYQKGGAVLAMFESWLGEAAFRDGVRLHMERFAHDVADVHDFLRSLADGSGREDVIDAFSSFLFQPGVPIVTASLECGGAEPVVRVAQSRYLPLGSTGSRDATWELPLCVAYDGDGGRVRHCTLVDTAEATIGLPAASSCPAWMMPNAEGAGYYRFALDEAGWAALFENFEALGEREARALLGSLSATYRSGDTTTATLVDAFRVLAASPDREVATAPLGDLRTLHGRLAVTPAAEAGIEAFVRDLYGERLAALGLEPQAGEGTDAALLRGTLTATLAGLGRDAELRRELKARAVAWLGEQEVDPSALDSGLVGTALAVAVEDSDLAFAERLLERALASRDATFRQRALGALAGSPDDAVAAMMRGLIADPRLRDNEAIQVAFAQVGTEEQRDAMWSWVQDEANLEALLARIPTWRKGAIANVGGGFCSAERAAEVEAFFAPRVEALEGGPRELAGTLESIRLCAALVAAKGDEVTAMFGGAR